MIENCVIKRKPLRETVYQLNANDHLIFSPKPLTSQIICQNGTHYPTQIIGTIKINIPDFCSIDLINHTISSDGNIRISPPALQMKMTLNLNLFPSEMMTALKHTDDEFNKLQNSIHKLQNDTMTDAQFDKMINKTVFSLSTFGIILWTIFGLSLSAIFLFFCWYCTTVRRNRARLQRIRRQNKEAEAGTPLRPLRRTHPLDDEEEEDEISYLARTGTVSKSFWPISFRRP